jgi:hypothetical protein
MEVYTFYKILPKVAINIYVLTGSTDVDQCKRAMRDDQNVSFELNLNGHYY